MIEIYKKIVFKKQQLDFPGVPVVENPPTNAGDVRMTPGPRRSHIPRGSYPRLLPQLPSLHSKAQELQQKKPPQWEAHALQLESNLTTREKPLWQQRPSTANNR